MLHEEFITKYHAGGVVDGPLKGIQLRIAIIASDEKCNREALQKNPWLASTKILGDSRQMR
jgi:hypothetical protein